MNIIFQETMPSTFYNNEWVQKDGTLKGHMHINKATGQLAFWSTTRHVSRGTFGL